MQANKRKEDNDDDEILGKVYTIIKRDLMIQEVNKISIISLT